MHTKEDTQDAHSRRASWQLLLVRLAPVVECGAAQPLQRDNIQPCGALHDHLAPIASTKLPGRVYLLADAAGAAGLYLVLVPQNCQPRGAAPIVQPGAPARALTQHRNQCALARVRSARHCMFRIKRTSEAA